MKTSGHGHRFLISTWDANPLPYDINWSAATYVFQRSGRDLMEGSQSILTSDF